MNANYGSKEVASSSIQLALTPDRKSEEILKKQLAAKGIASAAIYFGGEFIPSINKIVEHTIVAAKREGVVGETHIEEGAIAGCAREALSQIMNKAIGLNVGGKIAVARSGEHISVAMFFGIGLVHLNEIAIGLGHRAI